MNPGEPPRQPQNLQGLLRICMANTAEENQAYSANSMDAERREWLQAALNSLTRSDVDEMKKCIEVLQECNEAVASRSSSDDTFARQENALEALTDKVGSIDNANDFHKIGGFDILVPLLKSPNENVRAQTAGLVAELVQNNPYCQKASMEYNLLPVVLDLLNNDCDAVKIKAIHALSCLCRGYPPAQEFFEAQDGFSALLRAMQSPSDRLRVKASVMLTALARQQPSFRDILCSMGFVEQLAALIQSTEHDHTHEYLLGALLALVSEHQSSREECQRPELGLENILRQRVEFLKGKEEFLEECEHCCELFNICFGSSRVHTQELER